MIKIGDFAKLFDVSIKTIRFYEEKGLLFPAYIDIYTGYRYYDDQNIKEMCSIQIFKDLGLELKEIKNIDNDKIESKIKEYEEKISKIKNDIQILKTLSINDRGEIENMNKFINDEKAIGKWELLGFVDSTEDYKNKKIETDPDYIIKELYLMERGQKYWVISWSKDVIYINDKANAYEIDNDIMFVKIVGIFDDTEQKIAVYKKVNNKKYTINDIKIKDDLEVPFIKDDKIIGFYNAIDFVKDVENFECSKKQSVMPLYLEKMSISPSGDVTVYYSDGIVNTKYTKNYIFNLIIDDTLCKYFYKEIENNTYMFIEWKNGDYVYGKHLIGYYVLKKEK